MFQATLGMLPFPLLSDWHQTVTDSYGVLNTENEIAIRSVFVIDTEGYIRYRNVAFKAQESSHYEEVLKQLESL